jgi:AmmeMemoRadiSam system protein B
MAAISPARPSPIAGSWYPGDPVVLRNTVNSYMDAAEVKPLDGSLIGLVSPHAGYIYSGPTAGYAYRAIKGLSFDLVVVLSPLHAYRPEPFLTSAHESYETPLGNIEIDKSSLAELQTELERTAGFEITPIAYDREHSLEIQLPFLQCALSSPFHILPLMVREHREKPLKSFSQALARILEGKQVLLVVSTDLSHFFTEEEANRLDDHMLAQIQAFSPEGVLKAEEDGTGSACGNGAVAATLWTARELGAKKVSILHHSTSAQTTGDRSQVVGYGAAAICS